MQICHVILSWIIAKLNVFDTDNDRAYNERVKLNWGLYGKSLGNPVPNGDLNFIFNCLYTLKKHFISPFLM